MRRRTVALLAGGCAIGVAALAFWPRPSAPGTDNATQAPAGAGPGPGDGAALRFFDTPPSATASAPASAPGANWRPMLERFNHSVSYRALYFETQRHPEQGGYAYAHYAIANCPGQAWMASRAGTLPPRQAEVLDTLASRCDLTEEERQAALDASLARVVAGKFPDPEQVLEHELMRASNADEAKTALAALLEAGDPMSLMLILAVAHIDGSDPDGRQSMEFAGQRYALGGAKSDLFYKAQMLAICELGIDCGADSTAALMLCASRGWCAGSVAEAYRIGLADATGERFEQAATLGHAFAHAFKNKNVDAFLAARFR